MTNENWSIETNAGDFFGNQKKRQELSSRRPVPRNAADIGLGPGIGATAVKISDFNDPLATFNGFFAAYGGEAAANSPNGFHSFVGTVISDAVLGGTQTFTDLTDTKVWQRVFTRNPADAATIYWGTWKCTFAGTSLA